MSCYRIKYNDFASFGDAIIVKLGRETSTPVPSEPVPEPTSMLGLLAFAALGSRSLVKRKQQQKATFKA